MRIAVLACISAIICAVMCAGCLTTQPSPVTTPSPTPPFTEVPGSSPVPTETVTPELTPSPTTLPVVTRVPPPVAGFTANATSGTAPFTVRFTDTSAGSPTSWTWSFGDGATSELENPAHTYSSPGTYTVRLVASNSGGSNSETKVYYITVNPAFVPPGASFSAEPPTAAQPFTVQFLDRSTGPPTQWSWDFGDGGSSAGQNPVHTYPGIGTFIVHLEVVNPAGTSETTGYVRLG